MTNKQFVEIAKLRPECTMYSTHEGYVYLQNPNTHEILASTYVDYAEGFSELVCEVNGEEYTPTATFTPHRYDGRPY